MSKGSFSIPLGYGGCKMISRAVSARLRALRYRRSADSTSIEFDAKAPLWGMALSAYHLTPSVSSVAERFVVIRFKVGGLSVSAARVELLNWAVTTRGGWAKEGKERAFLESVGISAPEIVWLGNQMGEICVSVMLRSGHGVELTCVVP